jgi:hypothetical protein
MYGFKNLCLDVIKSNLSRTLKKLIQAIIDLNEMAIKIGYWKKILK